MNVSYDFYLLRTPGFSVNKLRILNEEIEIAFSNHDHDRLKVFFSEDLFVESIYLASKDLFNTLISWLNGILTDSKKIFSLLLTLHKYYIRMCTRPIPYGTFAFCSNGVIREAPTQISYSNKKIDRISRVDNGVIGKIVESLKTNESVKKEVLFYPNNSIIQVDGKYRYNEFKYKDTRREYFLSGLSANPYINSVYVAAKDGKKFNDLCSIIQALNKDLKQIDIESFIDDLIHNQFLVSEIDLRLTGVNHIDFLIQRFGSVKELSGIISTLQKGQTELKKNVGIKTYKNVERLLKKFNLDQSKQIIQTDTFVNNQNFLNSKICKELVSTAAELSQIAPLHSLPSLEEFKSEFIHKYENQEIPLLELLDPEIGIGYGLAKSGWVEDLPLLNKLQLPVVNTLRKAEPDSIDFLADLKIKQYYQSKAYEVEITGGEIEEIKKLYPYNSLAPSLYVMEMLTT